jgi:hypothetical protein
MYGGNQDTGCNLYYKFEDLEGIIFGFKTALENKIKIMKIIDEKCQKTGRTDFIFYQADYINGEMQINEIVHVTPRVNEEE